ncbi:MAG: hypothetical protein ABSE20_11525 [Acetobacteraceae bacterium]
MARRTRSRVIRASVPGLFLLALAACSAGPMGGAGDNAVGPSGSAAEGNTDLATQQACRQRVNEMYEVRNRGDIYTANPSVNSPFSANYQPDVPSRGLSNQFAYDQSLAECERNSANGAEGSTMAPPPPPAAKGH